MELLFATSNLHKVSEAQKIIGGAIKLISLQQLGVLDEIPEDYQTIEENALFKAQYLYRKTGNDTISDDTALEVEALGGAPGYLSARFAGEDADPLKNNLKLLEMLKGAPNRMAQFRTVIALIQGGREYLFEGVLKGEIVENPLGEFGFGYDPLFKPLGYTLTLAQMGSDQKNRISHRANALKALALFLNESKNNGE